ncbi:MAG: leucine-rich repeat domain-containing protein [Clostridiales bacterium]|nr:leucine-rich repeat domain-containing protein [Clostridiales bacterium]
MKKTIFTMMLAVCLAFTCICAVADENYTSGDWTFSVNRDGIVRVTGYLGEETHLVLPENLGGYPVTVVGKEAFRDNTSIKSVVIPDCYTTIEPAAFRGCTRIQNLSLGAGITSWPESWGSNGAFADCVNLFEIEFAPGITCIGKYAFENCTLLDTLTLPSTVTSVGAGAFKNCELLDIVEVYGDVGDEAFQNCSYMSDITLHNATYIGAHAFQGCTSMKEIELPQTLLTIGDEAFRGCSKLKGIIIPDSVTEMGARVYTDCLQMEKAVIGGSVAKWTVAWGDNSVFGNCIALTEVTVRPGVTHLPINAFRDCSHLTTVTLPEGLISIDDGAFENCTMLESIVFPASLETIGNKAFCGCSLLGEAALPESLVSIGKNAFEETALTEVIIPAKTVTIGAYAFKNCASLTHVTLGEQLTNWSEDWAKNGAFMNCTSLKTLTIESGVNSIGSYAFYGCSSLEMVEIPSTSILVDEYAFAECTSLKEATVYRGVIGNHAFENCTALESLSIRKVTDIYGSAFNNCSKLTGVELPRTLITLEKDAFRNCSSLTEIIVPDSTTTLGAYAFGGCTGLKTAYVSNNINDWALDWGNSQIFIDCTALEYVCFGDGLTSIEEEALMGCTGLKGVYIPSSVTYIHDSAFKNAASDCVIYGQSGSPAEAFAISHNLAFSTAEFPFSFE